MNTHSAGKLDSILTLSDSLKARAASPFTTSSKVEEAMFPTARWKKHGLTDPSTSTTAETHGRCILEIRDGSPKCSRNRRGIRRSFSPIHYVFAADIVGMFHNELFHLILKGGSLVRVQRNFTLSLSRPY